MYIWLNAILQGGVLTPETPPCVRLCTKVLNDAATSALPFGNINRFAKAWWSPEIAEAVARAHCFEEDRQNYEYISISKL